MAILNSEIKNRRDAAKELEFIGKNVEAAEMKSSIETIIQLQNVMK